jgi:hypothetical protein
LAPIEQLGLGLFALLFAQPLETLLDDGEIGEHQLALEALDVAHGIGRVPGHRIGEATHHLHQRVGIAHLHQRRLIEHARAFRAAGKVDEHDLGIGRLAR